MRPKPSQRMYIDDLIESNERLHNLFTLGGGSLNDRNYLRTLQKKEMISVFNNFQFMKILKDHTHTFWIDAMIIDNLYNKRHETQDYRNAIKLPFPFVFFEFERSIESIQPDGKKEMLKGSLFFKELTFEEQVNKIIQEEKIVIDNTKYLENLKKIKEDKFVVTFFSEPEKNYNPLSFKLSELPNFYFSNPSDMIIGLYKFDYKKNNAYHLENILGEDKIGEPIIFPQETIISMRKSIDLTINLVNYINAQNVVVRNSEPRDRPDLPRINRKRIRDGKKPIPQLKPYSWVEVRKSYVDEEDKGGIGQELKWRVWVRGHFRHYQSGLCDWIEPYIKGPKNAPWRHHRYQTLYKNFKNHLTRRGDEVD